jgi:hypothetical protein
MGTYWKNVKPSPAPGPVWELETGRQVVLDYAATQLCFSLLEQESGELFLQQKQGDSRRGIVTSCETLSLYYDSERVLCEFFISYPMSNGDLMESPGGFPYPNNREEDPQARFFQTWKPDFSTLLSWEWSPSELLENISSDPEHDIGFDTGEL